MKTEKFKNSKLTLIIILTIVLVTATTGITYAFFSANLIGAETATTITAGGGTMSITYAGGTAINASNIYPKAAAFATKTITITGNNTTDLPMDYSLTLQVNTNTFSSSALKYQLASTNTGSNGTIIPAKPTSQNIATGASAIVLGNGTFVGPTGGNKVHTYVLTLYFPDTGADQNVDQGKNFTAHVKIANV